MKFGKKQVRYLAMTAILAAVSAVLMMISFSVPLVPSFLKMDISEMPALIATFSMGPVSGVLVCLIKNLINLPMTTTGGVGELANFCGSRGCDLSLCKKSQGCFDCGVEWLRCHVADQHPDQLLFDLSRVCNLYAD